MNKDTNLLYTNSSINFTVNMKINQPPYFKDPLKEVVITLSFDTYEYRLPPSIDDEGDNITMTALTT